MKKSMQNTILAASSLTFVLASLWVSDVAAYRKIAPQDGPPKVVRAPVPEQKPVAVPKTARPSQAAPTAAVPKSIPVPKPLVTIYMTRAKAAPAGTQKASQIKPSGSAKQPDSSAGGGLPQSRSPLQIAIATKSAEGAQITENNPELVQDRRRVQDNTDSSEKTQIIGLDINRSDIYRTFADPNSPVPPSVEFNIPHLPQEEPLWCWAAAAQQAIGWVNNGKAPAQCAIVALAHGINVKTCCNDRKGVCAKTGEIPAISALVQKYGGIAYKIAVPQKPTDIYSRLVAGKTMLIRLRPTPEENAVGIRHMIMVRGIQWYRLPNGKLQANLFYNDPLGANARMVDFHDIVEFFEEALLISRD